MNVFDLQATLTLDTSGYDKGLDEAAGTAKKAGTSIGSIFGGTLASNLATQGINAIMSGTQAAIGGIADITKSAVDSYATYEQLVGGVDKLYGDASEKLQEYADNAYKTSGMSANQYMETATSFSASLIQSLGGDVNEAADMTDVAMRAMSDNVNTFGSSMESVTNAFQGFAKGNYTMLDNLKLGYGGTKSEMERLIEDAEQLNETFVAQRDEEGKLLLNFADIITAIQTVQEEQNIAGTTNKEAMSTIEGSAAATKAAWENVITAIGRGEGLDEALDGLISSLFGGEGGGGLIENMLPKFATAMEGFGVFIERIAPVVAEKLPGLVSTLTPIFLSAITSLLLALSDALPSLATTLFDAISTFAENLLLKLPPILRNIMKTVIGLFESITEFIPDLIPVVVEVLLELVQIIVDNASLLLDAAIALINALVEGILDAVPVLTEAAPTLIESLIKTLLSLGNQLISAGETIIITLLEGLTDALPSFLQMIAEIIPLIVTTVLNELPQLIEMNIKIFNNFIQGIADNLPALLLAIIQAVKTCRDTIFNNFKDYDWLGIGKNIIQGIIDGIDAMEGVVAAAVVKVASNMKEGIKDFFGIRSPSRVMRDEVGKMLALGLGEGFEENAPDLQGMVDDMMVEPNLSLSASGIGGINLAGGLEGLQVIAPVYIGQTLIDTVISDAITRQEYTSGGR